MRTVGILLLGLVLGSTLTARALQRADLMAEAATREAVSAVKRGIVEGHRKRDRAALDQL